MFTDDAKVGIPYWWEGRQAAAAPADGALPPRVDLVVVGGGYTGLSAAIAAHDAGASVVVLDAGQPGDGASTRNGGMFGAHPRLAYGALVQRFGADVAAGITGEALAAFDFTKGLIAKENIDCDLQASGRISLAWTKAHHEGQKTLLDDVTRVGGGRMELVAKAELGAHINTERYFGGVLFPDHAALHPRKFHDGLLQACARRGVPVIAECKVTGWQRSRSGFLVETARGVVRSESLLAATNGYTSGLFPKLAARVFALPSFLIATEPLSPNLIADLAPGGRMMVETRARHSYFRPSPDGSRILFGGRAAMRPIPLPLAAARLRATMAEVWPILKDVRLSHVWTGNTGYSFSHTPQVGEMGGVHFAMGYSGSGVAMAPYLGMKAAYHALGDPRGETAYLRTTFKTHPLHWGRPWFRWPVDRWYQWAVDPAQNAEAAKDSRAG